MSEPLVQEGKSPAGNRVLSTAGLTKRAAPEKGFSLWQDAWRRLKRNKMAMGSLAALILKPVAASSFTPGWRCVQPATSTAAEAMWSVRTSAL